MTKEQLEERNMGERREEVLSSMKWIKKKLMGEKNAST
jgi:hypothetical protein